MNTVFHSPDEVQGYFQGATIECLLCGRLFRRLARHLAVKHGMSADDYRARFGLPWSRGLSSQASHAASASTWTDSRKRKARKLARQTRFFEKAHDKPRRRDAPFLKEQYVENLGRHAIGFGEELKREMRKLFDKGWTDAAIANHLDVGRATVTYVAMHWRKSKRKNRK